MSETISIQQINALKNEFKRYLRATHVEWSDNTILTTNSDAFFALNNNVGIDFWSSFESEEAMKNLRNKIRDYLRTEKSSPNAEDRANGYLASFRHLKEFLDKMKPSLAKEWQGKVVSVENLRADFQQWMKAQKKTNGQNYSSNTVAAYTTALKNATAKLELGDAVHSDLFYYTSVDEFEDARQLILAAPNFEEIDIAAGNKAYSNGMVLYTRFLSELGEPTAWIFQGNSKYYDVQGYIAESDTITWSVNQNKKQIKQGDKVYIWLSGADGGIIAAGTILCAPEMRQPIEDDPYTREESFKSEPYPAVDIKIERKFNPTISRNVFLADERTKQLGVFSFPVATNYRVSKLQEAVIESIINGSYIRIAAVDIPEADPDDEIRYWLYAPGEGAKDWRDNYSEGIMSIGWDELGDYSQYKSKADIREAVNKLWDDGKDHRNDTLTVWNFRSVMKPGDIVYVKRGISSIIGRGEIIGDYEFHGERLEHHNVRRVRWTHDQEIAFPDRLKSYISTLGDISGYSEVIKSMEEQFGVIEAVAIPIITELYSKEDFLSEVYIDDFKYETLVNILTRKKNIILQGPPGVGKTFAAQRLAYSIIGQRDKSRVKVVQFHQSYSYEDFVMGFRPDGNGFKLVNGPFYEFCRKASQDDENRPYFFIIDEINRGNLSKIFGELLMLIESDKRGEEYAMRLLYADERFYVPVNVHIIGMMNTADRSLAMIDYALRRRFAFFDLEPAFQSDGFKARQALINNPKFDTLINVIESLNKAITEDASLGSGFKVGHSYFCTSDIVDDNWIASVAEYELLPLLQEYWFDEPSKVENWSALLRKSIRV